MKNTVTAEELNGWIKQHGSRLGRKVKKIISNKIAEEKYKLQNTFNCLGGYNLKHKSEKA